MNIHNFKKNFSRWCIGVSLTFSLILSFVAIAMIQGLVSAANLITVHEGFVSDEIFFPPDAIIGMIIHMILIVSGILLGSAWLGSIVTFICMKRLKRNWTIPAIITLVLVIVQLLFLIIYYGAYLGAAINITLVSLILWFLGWLVAVCIFLWKTREPQNYSDKCCCC